MYGCVYEHVCICTYMSVCLYVCIVFNKEILPMKSARSLFKILVCDCFIWSFSFNDASVKDPGIDLHKLMWNFTVRCFVVMTSV